MLFEEGSHSVPSPVVTTMTLIIGVGRAIVNVPWRNQIWAMPNHRYCRQFALAVRPIQQYPNVT